MVDTLLFKRIKALPNLRPSKETNALFSRMVSFCTNSSTKDVTLSHFEIQELRSLSAQAECAMEEYWSQKIATSDNPFKTLTTFWYYQNYCDLVRSEMTHLQKTSPQIQSLLFVGGGPLPLSALLAAQEYGITCTVLEKEPHYAALAQSLVKALSLQNLVRIILVDAERYTDYTSHDCIVLASMLETHARRRDFMNGLHAMVGSQTTILVRTVHGARSLLYTPYTEQDLGKFKKLAEVIPTHHIINSFFIAQKT